LVAQAIPNVDRAAGKNLNFFFTEPVEIREVQLARENARRLRLSRGPRSQLTIEGAISKAKNENI
jgi:hypothetical protein